MPPFGAKCVRTDLALILKFGALRRLRLLSFHGFHSPEHHHRHILTGNLLPDAKAAAVITVDDSGRSRSSKIRLIPGILCGIGTTLIRPDDSITEGKIVIGGTVYNCENGDALLGQSVIFYTGRDGGDPDRNIRYIVSDDKMNHMMTISGDDVIGKTGGTVRYWSNDKERTVKVSETADVIYNGIAYPDYTEEDLKPGAGTVIRNV